MTTAELLEYIRSHSIEAWEHDGRIVAISQVLQGTDLRDTIAILDGYCAVRRWLGY